MALRAGDRGGESITVKSLGRATKPTTTVPGDGQGRPDLRPQPRNAERSASNYGAALGAKFGYGDRQRSE